jgi:hypothetical protein
MAGLCWNFSVHYHFRLTQILNYAEKSLGSYEIEITRQLAEVGFYVLTLSNTVWNYTPNDIVYRRSEV